ncbi:hypothetical protein QBC34DRAFT_34051 [Podospora aff. communis PSN243]|uniref:Uncharacterized protein n=1 Tax=Podospora aff. communis PSN243 TaxID=3040156 RepID=A0AAV9GYC4_9PEZI|nr:hypothetical protein QBC34DRAFT_34051 [Podospora aff. communis PSN243]
MTQNGEEKLLRLAALLVVPCRGRRVLGSGHSRPRLQPQSFERKRESIESRAHLITALPTDALPCFWPSQIAHGRWHRNSRIEAAFALYPPPCHPVFLVAKLSVCDRRQRWLHRPLFCFLPSHPLFRSASPFPSSLQPHSTQTSPLGTGDLIRPPPSILSTSSCVVRPSSTIPNPSRNPSKVTSLHRSSSLFVPARFSSLPPRRTHPSTHNFASVGFVSHHGLHQHSN